MTTRHSKVICAFCSRNGAESYYTLICGHSPTSCLTCIDSLTKFPGNFACPRCRQISEVGDAAKGVRFANKICHLCQVQAEVLCVTCQLLLCKDHVKKDLKAKEPCRSHLFVFSLLRPMKLNLKHFCKQRNYYDAYEACVNCLRVFCEACNTEQGCKNGMHEFKAIAPVSKTLQTRVEELQRLLSNKKAQLSKLEKEIIASTNQFNDEAIKLQKDVDKDVNEKIKFIRQEGERVKGEIMRSLNEYKTNQEKLSKQVKSSDEQADVYLSKLQELKSLEPSDRTLEKLSAIEKEADKLLNEDIQPVNSPKAHLVKQAGGHITSLGVEFQYVSPIYNQEPKGASRVQLADSPGYYRSNTDNIRAAELKFSITLDHVTLDVYTGDITSFNCPAIVNAANSELKHRDGVAAAIAEASTPRFQTDSLDHVKRLRRYLDDGEVFTQKSTGRLRESGIEFVINTVGPRYSDYRDDDGCETKLIQAVFASIEEAERIRCPSIAIPAISSGGYGVPIGICTKAYWKAVMRFVREGRHYLKKIHFVDIDDEITTAISEDFRKFSRIPESPHFRSVNFGSTIDDMRNGENHLRPSSDTEQLGTRHKKHGHKTDTISMEGGLGVGAERNSTDSKTQRSNKKNEDSQTNDQACASAASEALKHSERKRLQVDLMEECDICAVEKHPSEFITLPCKHRMCALCETQVRNVTKSNLCPTCRAPFTVASGPQPKGGNMRVSKRSSSVTGYEKYGMIVIDYYIPDGTQTVEHPHPGKPFRGTTRTAYLPDSSDGQRVCRMLEKAFNAGLIFTVSRSLTSGNEDVVVWNDIHHKTSTHGAHGYPDPNYLASVEADLRARGITDP